MEAGGQVEAASSLATNYRPRRIFAKFMSGMAGCEASNFEKRGASVADLTFASDTNARTGTLDIETINPTCIE